MNIKLSSMAAEYS